MTPEMDLPTGRILSTTLHHIDIGGQVCERVAIPGEADDLEQYLSELLGEIGNKPQKREYALAAQTTEFARALRVFYEEPDLSMCDEAEGLAGRLLRIEITTDNKFGHLNPEGTGHVKKGSFLQFIYKDGHSIQYLGVKIEHQSFIDEEDFRRKIGLGETQKVYKACKVGFDKDGQVFDVLIFDTNSKPSTYWWRDFWELTELRTDEHNTKTAIKAVTKTLAPLKKVSRADYTLLRNASVAAFKKEGRMNFDEFVTEVFSTYSAETEQSEKKIKEITKKL
ncbi:nucleoid-associated protein [Salinisphaera sp.]|uniref:nucleoid-associated protein n=1 Tax=Salinisphaera sp. TaxID=1914330 RepID=UPI0025CFC2D0|nr:nucleoid-associated protein [Salinisphaera sp.]